MPIDKKGQNLWEKKNTNWVAVVSHYYFRTLDFCSCYCISFFDISHILNKMKLKMLFSLLDCSISVVLLFFHVSYHGGPLVNFNLVFLVILCGVVFVVIFMFLTKVWYHVVFSEMYDLLTGCHLGFSCCVCHLKNRYVFWVQSIVVGIPTKSSTLEDWRSIGCA